MSNVIGQHSVLSESGTGTGTSTGNSTRRRRPATSTKTKKIKIDYNIKFRDYFKKIEGIGYTPLDFLNIFYETINYQFAINKIKKIDNERLSDIVKFLKRININLDIENDLFYLLSANLMVAIAMNTNPTATNLWSKKTVTIGSRSFELPSIKQITFNNFSKTTFRAFNSQLRTWMSTYYKDKGKEIYRQEFEEKFNTEKMNSFRKNLMNGTIKIETAQGHLSSYTKLNDFQQVYVFVRNYFNTKFVNVILSKNNFPELLPLKSFIKTRIFDKYLITEDLKEQELLEGMKELGVNISNSTGVNNSAAAAAAPNNINNNGLTEGMEGLGLKNSNQFEKGALVADKRHNNDPTYAEVDPLKSEYASLPGRELPEEGYAILGNTRKFSTGSIYNEPGTAIENPVNTSQTERINAFKRGQAEAEERAAEERAAEERAAAERAAAERAAAERAAAERAAAERTIDINATNITSDYNNIGFGKASGTRWGNSLFGREHQYTNYLIAYLKNSQIYDSSRICNIIQQFTTSYNNRLSKTKNLYNFVAKMKIDGQSIKDYVTAKNIPVTMTGTFDQEFNNIFYDKIEVYLPSFYNYLDRSGYLDNYLELNAEKQEEILFKLLCQKSGVMAEFSIPFTARKNVDIPPEYIAQFSQFYKTLEQGPPAIKIPSSGLAEYVNNKSQLEEMRETNHSKLNGPNNAPITGSLEFEEPNEADLPSVQANAERVIPEFRANVQPKISVEGTIPKNLANVQRVDLRNNASLESKNNLSLAAALQRPREREREGEGSSGTIQLPETINPGWFRKRLSKNKPSPEAEGIPIGLMRPFLSAQTQPRSVYNPDAPTNNISNNNNNNNNNIAVFRNKDINTPVVSQIRAENLNERGMPKEVPNNSSRPTFDLQSATGGIETAGNVLNTIESKIPLPSNYGKRRTLENNLNDPKEINENVLMKRLLALRGSPLPERNNNNVERTLSGISTETSNRYGLPHLETEEETANNRNLREQRNKRELEDWLKANNSGSNQPNAANVWAKAGRDQAAAAERNAAVLAHHNTVMYNRQKILIPGNIFNEIPSGISGRFVDKPGKGKTAKTENCGDVFKFEPSFNEQNMLARCKDRDVLIVSHNKRLQQLIGDMFPNFAKLQNEKGGCKFGIANCSVIEIYKDIGEEFEETKSLPEVPNHPNILNYNDPKNFLPAIEERNRIIQQRKEALERIEKGTMIQDASTNYKLRVLFDGFPDKEECIVSKSGGAYTKKRGTKKGTKKNTKNTKKTKKYRGGASSYHYLKANDYILDEKFSKQYNDVMEGESLFEKMFKAGAKRIILVRHGNGPHNKPYSDKTIINPPLTALGVYQAYLAGQAINRLGVLDLSKLFSLTSQLKRAQQTALQFLVSAFQVEGSLPNTFIKNCTLCLSNVYNKDTRDKLKSKSFYKLLDDLNPGTYDVGSFLEFVYKYNLVNETNYKQGIASFEAKRQKKRANAALEKTANTIATSLDAAEQQKEIDRAKAEQQKEIDRAKAEQQKLMKKYKPFECWRFLNGGKPVQVIINQVISNKIIYQTWNIELKKYNEEENMPLSDFDNLPGLKKLKMCPDIALGQLRNAQYRGPSPSVGTVHNVSTSREGIATKKSTGHPYFKGRNTGKRRLGLRKPVTGGKQKTKKRIKKTKNGKKNKKKKLITKRKNRKKNKKRTRKC